MYKNTRGKGVPPPPIDERVKQRTLNSPIHIGREDRITVNLLPKQSINIPGVIKGLCSYWSTQGDPPRMRLETVQCYRHHYSDRTFVTNNKNKI